MEQTFNNDQMNMKYISLQFILSLSLSPVCSIADMEGALSNYASMKFAGKAGSGTLQQLMDNNNEQEGDISKIHTALSVFTTGPSS